MAMESDGRRGEVRRRGVGGGGGRSDGVGIGWMNEKVEEIVEEVGREAMAMMKGWKSGTSEQQRALERWRDAVLQIVTDGVAGITGREVLGRHCGGRRKRSGVAMFASVSNSSGFGSVGGGGRRIRFQDQFVREDAASEAYTPVPGTYAYDSLRRHFKELDQDGLGFISEGDLKVALKKLNLPASQKDVKVFMGKVCNTSQSSKITFEEFAEYAVQRENELVDTFKELDKRKIGYISEDGMKAALQKYNFCLNDHDIALAVEKVHVRGSGSSQFYGQSKAFDFAEYRDVLMFSTAKELRGTSEIWGACVIDLGDVDASYPVASGGYSKQGSVSKRGAKVRVKKRLFDGGISSAVARTILAPLERVKIISMVDKQVANASFVDSLKNIWRDEGVGGLFKGNTLNVMRIAPTKAVEFFVYDKLKEAILNRTQRVDLTGPERMLLGAIACIAGTFVTHPMDTVRSVITTQSAGVNKGMMEVSRAILEKEGWQGFYRGLAPHMIRVAPYGAINFFVYDQLKQWYRNKKGPGAELGPLPIIIFGALAGAAAQVVVYPLETIQRRLQIQASRQGPIVYKNMIHAFQSITCEEGAAALYAGLAPNYAKLLPAAAISFLVYEALQKQWDLK